MEELNVLSPNTAAFLDSIALGDFGEPQQQHKTINPATSFPPSVLFPVPLPVPGRDTPESSPSSVGDPKSAAPHRSLSLSDVDSDNDMNDASAQNHKRKNSEADVKDEDDDDGALLDRRRDVGGDTYVHLPSLPLLMSPTRLPLRERPRGQAPTFQRAQARTTTQRGQEGRREGRQGQHDQGAAS